MDRYYNCSSMFVGQEHLSIGYSQLNTSAEEFHDSVLKTHGISLCDRNERRMTYKGELPVFGPCYIYVDIPTDYPICHVRITTKRKVSEEEMLSMLEYMRKSMPVEPYYDDHGYGVLPKPHEIELVWELPQGNVDMSWDGFKYDRGNGLNLPKGDGYDFVTIDLWDCSSIRRSRDEAYWRSEVD